jgi:hypothetical protein
VVLEVVDPSPSRILAFSHGVTSSSSRILFPLFSSTDFLPCDLIGWTPASPALTCPYVNVGHEIDGMKARARARAQEREREREYVHACVASS